jgi:hypothetical protein
MSVHVLAARAIAPIVLAIIYGIYEFIARGASSDLYLTSPSSAASRQQSG